VSGAGDVNADGYDDILIGAYLADVSNPAGDSRDGETYLIYGSAALNGTVSLGDASVVTFTGEAAGDYSGIAVSGAGDVNADGYDDMLIGAYYADPGGILKAGKTYLVYGGSTLDGTVSLGAASVAKFTGKAASDWSGGSVSDAGDVNGDGFGDILIGAFGADSEAGETYLLLGSGARADR
jgi:hypothetical protein